MKGISILLLIFVSVFCALISGWAGGTPQEAEEVELSLWYYWETPGHQETLAEIVGVINETINKVIIIIINVFLPIFLIIYSFLSYPPMIQD